MSRWNEIERKFLAVVNTAGGRLEGDLDKDMEVRQGYIVVRKNFEVRLRYTHEFLPVEKKNYHLALKVGNGYIRKEYEFEVPRWVYLVLRYFVPHFLHKHRQNLGGWDVDTFFGSLDGLVLAEAEVDCAHDALPPPPRGLVLARDVTDERTYANKNLSRLSEEEQRILVAWARAEMQTGVAYVHTSYVPYRAPCQGTCGLSEDVCGCSDA